MEKEMLDCIKDYLNTKVHPTVLRQLEVWKSKQTVGSSLAESMRHQMQQFYDTRMDQNTPEDWLKLLLYSTGGDKEIMTKIFTNMRSLNIHMDILDLVVAEESGWENTERLLGMGDRAARTGLQGGQQGAGGMFMLGSIILNS